MSNVVVVLKSVSGDAAVTLTDATFKVTNLSTKGTVDLADAYYRLGYKTEAIRCYKDLLNNWDERIYKELKNEWRKKIRELDK